VTKKPPHHVPSQESQNPHPPPTCRAVLCETNPIYSLFTAHYSLFLQNEPNLPWPTANRQQPKAAFYETNPIPPDDYAKRTQSPVPLASRRLSRTPKMRNEPNLIHPFVPHAPIIRNEPNLPHNIHSTIYNIQSNGPIPHSPGAPKPTQTQNTESTIHKTTCRTIRPYPRRRPCPSCK